MEFLVSKEDKNKAGVYCITNKINNKIYIGSTSRQFYLRYHQHKSDYLVGKREIKILYRAFDKYGIDNFKFEIVCICKKEDCIKMEQFYIDKGVDYNCAMIAGSLLGIKHPPNSKTRMVIRGHHHCAVAVDMYSKEGKFIKSFTSLIEAQEATSIKSKSNITQCCKGKVFSAGGYRWTCKGEALKNRPNRYGKCKVALSKGEFYKEFDSQESCASYLRSIGKVKCSQGQVNLALKRKGMVHNFNIKKI